MTAFEAEAAGLALGQQTGASAPVFLYASEPENEKICHLRFSYAPGGAMIRISLKPARLHAGGEHEHYRIDPVR